MLTDPRVVRLQAPPAPPLARSPRLAKPPRRICFLCPRLSPCAPGAARLMPSPRRRSFGSSLAPLLRGIAPSRFRLLIHSRIVPSPLPVTALASPRVPPHIGLSRFLVISSRPVSLLYPVIRRGRQPALPLRVPQKVNTPKESDRHQTWMTLSPHS